MGWQSEYTELLKERLLFGDLNVELGAEKNPEKLLANFQERLSLLKHAASEGNTTAKAMCLLLCEASLRTMKKLLTSSSAYQNFHKFVMDTLDEL